MLNDWKLCADEGEGGKHRKDNVGHVPLLSHNLQPRHGIHIAHDVSDDRRTVLFHLYRSPVE